MSDLEDCAAELLDPLLVYCRDREVSPCCCDAGNCSVVGEPASAITNKFEMEGREHLEFSSIGGEGGG